MEKILNELKKLRDIYSIQDDFEIGPKLKVKMKIVNSEEETEIHAYAMNYEQGLAYLYAVKRETLCRSIIAFNDKELPEIIKDNNEAIQRHIWVRTNIISGWNQILVEACWVKYAELITKVENNLAVDLKVEEKA